MYTVCLVTTHALLLSCTNNPRTAETNSKWKQAPSARLLLPSWLEANPSVINVPVTAVGKVTYQKTAALQYPVFQQCHKKKILPKYETCFWKTLNGPNLYGFHQESCYMHCEKENGDKRAMASSEFCLPEHRGCRFLRVSFVCAFLTLEGKSAFSS